MIPQRVPEERPSQQQHKRALSVIRALIEDAEVREEDKAKDVIVLHAIYNVARRR